MKTITIIYKSGVKVTVKCSAFTIKKYVNGNLDIEWKDMTPRPMLLGVDEIAAIYEGKA